ncbi:type II toxin-antitoxin system VapC family toxin [Methylocystis sp. JR02]|uniref:type II toxin-antitoxin system VapC family toxin n=1 Tax=Methylocystis sp. JR02 TaxID=3046284 RepID=UPI0024BB16EA|nr:type II toxin-antitoxin system VapC family toxin [Methylocystis sp. JR02]MDJ0447739.1 type II toxin-antitoxin system VapC family toxin [Methylocystis sp. JR02]
MTIRIYLDSNVFIDAFENDDVPVTRGRRVLDHVRNGGAIGVISELVVAELLTKPLENDDAEMYEAYVSLFDSSRTIETHPIDQRVLVRAARLRATVKSLKMPDAIHAATAQIQGCAGFVTADRRLLSALGINAVPLDSSTVDNIRALA